jgi:hypothetical protein
VIDPRGNETDFSRAIAKINHDLACVGGPKGRVIGIDMTDEILEVARRNAPIVAERIGYANVGFRPIESDLENYSHPMVFEPERLNDALENAVLRAFRALDRYHDDASFSAWMIRILTNKIYAIKLQTRSRCQFESLEIEEAVLV